MNKDKAMVCLAIGGCLVILALIIFSTVIGYFTWLLWSLSALSGGPLKVIIGLISLLVQGIATAGVPLLFRLNK